MSYAEYVGLQLNKHRVWKQWAVATLAGMAACGNAPLTDDWGDAVADDPFEAAEIVYDVNRDRAAARARSRQR